MSSIDERVVEMKFRDSDFGKGVARTLDSLKNLKEGLKLDGATKGLEDVGAAADEIDLSGIEKDAKGINPMFAALATVGVTALSRLTNSAIDFGKSLVANVTEPLFEGGKRRALNLENARYSFKMLGIDATKAMEDANYAVEGTAYSLDVAAKAASQLSASQVALGDDMKAALRGISGVAALTNSSYEDISEVFTKVAGQGRLMGDDLNRLGTRGMNAAAVLAKSFGTTEAELRKMVSQGKVSFMDFAKAMDDAYGENAVSAAETYSGALGQMRTALARIGADIAAPKFEALRRIYNALAPAINGVRFAILPLLDMFGEFQTMKADNLVAMLEDIVKVGFGDYKNDKNSPLVALQEGFKNVADSILNVVRPIREAWNQVFPPSLGGLISKFSFWFRDFTGSLKITGEAASVIKTIFVGVFSTLKVGFSIIANVVGVLFNGLGLLFRLLGAIGGVFAPIIEGLFGLVSGFKGAEGGAKNATSALDIFFNAIKWAQNFLLEPIIALLKSLGAGLDAFINDGKTAKQAFAAAFKPILDLGKKIGETFGIAGDIVEERFGAVAKRLKANWEGLMNVLRAVGNFFKPLVSAMGEFFGNIRTGISQMLAGADLNTVLATINTGVLIAFGTGLYKIIKRITSAFEEVGSIKQSFIGILDGITDSFGEMQKKLKAEALLKIAAAIGIMSLSLVLLATVEPERLISSAIAIGTVAIILLKAVEKFSELSKAQGIIKMPFIAYSMILLGTALVVVSTAVKIMSSLSWEELARGLSGFAVALGGLLAAAKVFSTFQRSIFKTAAAMVAFATAIMILTGAIVALGKIKLETLIQGLSGVAVALGLMVGAAAIMSKNAGGMTKAAGGILAMAVSLGMLTGVIIVLGLIPWEILTKGLFLTGIMIVGLVAAAKALSTNAGGMTKAAGGILAMAFAIGMLVSAVAILGLIPFGTLIQGLAGLAGVMLIMVVAARAMSGIQSAIPGMLGLAGALLIMSISLKLLSTIPMEAMLIALGALAALLLIIGIAGTVLGPMAPVLLALAGALALFGLALVLISGAMLIFSIALASLIPSMLGFIEVLKGFAAASEEILGSVPAMLAVGAALIVFGLGAAAAGIGIGILGIALILVGVGLALIGAVGIIGATALTAVVLAIVNLLEYAGPLALMAAVLLGLGVALVAVGIGGLLAGAALIVVGVGLLIVAAAMMVLGPALTALSAGLQEFVPHANEFIEAVPAMIALGAGLLAFGVGAIIAALGIGLLGIALIALGAGLMVVEAAGTGSAKVIKKVTEEVAALWGHALNIGIVAAALAGLGAALLVLGGGLLLTSAGGAALMGVLFLFIGLGEMFANAIDVVVKALKKLNKTAPTITKSVAALAPLNTAITKLGASSLAASLGIGLVAMNFSLLGVSAMNMSTMVQAASQHIIVSMKNIVAATKTLPPAVQSMATNATTAFLSLSKGVDNATKRVRSSVTTLGVAIRTTVSSAVNSAKTTASSSGASIGTAITSGMTRGINNGSSSVSAAARRVAANALAAAKRELDSHSPSKKFMKLGEDSDEGFALGLEGSSHIVAKAASNVGGTAIYALKKSISDISNAVAMDPDMQPTITPVLDLSEVKKGAVGMKRIFGDSPQVDTAALYRDAANWRLGTPAAERETAMPSVTNVTFNQNNQSPKALSEAEIYRQTNNLVSRLKKGVGESNVA